MNNLKNFHECIKDLSVSDAVLFMDNYIQHGDITTLEHVVSVALSSYLFALKSGLDARLAARGAMLHDLYLYDWHIKDTSKRPPLTHGFTHPAVAVKNAKLLYNISKREEQIIRNHMWPLTIFHIPPTREAMVVSIADKICAFRETTGTYNNSKEQITVKKYIAYIKHLNKLKK